VVRRGLVVELAALAAGAVRSAVSAGLFVSGGVLMKGGARPAGRANKQNNLVLY
jgi:hypothetical protein